MQPKQGLLIGKNSSINDEQLEQMIHRNKSIEDYYFIEREVFARGKFACVRRIKHRQNGQQYAAKIIKRRRPRHGDVTDEILHEIRVLLESLNSERIVRLYEVYETRLDFTLVLELAEGGELQKVLDDEETIDERQCCRIVRQIIEGIQFLHQKQIAHLDIKPQNILLTDSLPNGNVKLCDFGISRLIDDQCEVREIMGTVDYMPPEILQYEPITLAADIWSLGIVTYVLLSGHSPFGGDDKQQTYSNITSSDLEFPEKLFSNISDLAKDFISKLLIRDPKKRLTCDECLQHPWLSMDNDNDVTVVVDNNNSLLLTTNNDLKQEQINENNNQTSDLEEEEDVEDDDESVDNNHHNDLAKRTKLRSETSDSKSSSMTLSSISSLDDHLDHAHNHQKQLHSIVDDAEKQTIPATSTSTTLPLSSSTMINNNVCCDSGLGENFCDTIINGEINNHSINDSKMEKCHQNNDNHDNNNNNNKENQIPKQNLLYPTTTINTTKHKRLSSDIFPDRKSFIDIISNSLRHNQQQSKKFTSESSMSSSMISSGDRPILVNLHNHMCTRTTSNNYDNDNINNMNNNKKLNADTHSPPSTPSKKLNLSIDDYIINQWNYNDNNYYSNIRSSSMQRLNTLSSASTASTTTKSSQLKDHRITVDNTNDLLTPTETTIMKTIPLATIETHSSSTISTTTMDNPFLLNDSNTMIKSSSSSSTTTTIIHHPTITATTSLPMIEITINNNADNNNHCHPIEINHK